MGSVVDWRTTAFEPWPEAVVVAFMLTVTSPDEPAPPPLCNTEVLPFITRPPPPATDCATTACAPAPVVVIGAFTVTVTASELPLPATKVGVTELPVESTAPPPPPTLWARMPKALSPVVEMRPLEVTVTAPPDSAPLGAPPSVAAPPLETARPPPPPTLCATRPIDAAPDVVIAALLVSTTALGVAPLESPAVEPREIALAPAKLSPPPPLTLCAMIPDDRFAAVAIRPDIFTLTAPPGP